jgi:mannose-6-phosphate isomerase
MANTAEHNDIEDHRPWGYFVVLSDESDHKVKRITVYPDKRLSLQRHRHRSEHWVIINGNALVTLEDKEIPLKKGQSIDIPLHAAHRIRNIGQDNLIFIEIQQGEYFGEDDIERIEDDFGRIPAKES